MSLILKSISVENFKCFHSPQSVELSKLTMLTGANSSGKSSILYALLSCLQSSNFPFYFSPNGKYVQMGDFSEISYKHYQSKLFTIGFSFVESRDKIEYDIITKWMHDSETKLPSLQTLILKSVFIDLTIDKRGDKYLLTSLYTAKNDPQNRRTEKDIFIEKINRAVYEVAFTFQKGKGGSEKSKKRY